MKPSGGHGGRFKDPKFACTWHGVDIWLVDEQRALARFSQTFGPAQIDALTTCPLVQTERVFVASEREWRSYMDWLVGSPSVGVACMKCNGTHRVPWPEAGTMQDCECIRERR